PTAKPDSNLDIAIYKNGWEHINDELNLLDQRIRKQIQVQHSLQGNMQFNQFKGLLITAEEIESLLNYSDLHVNERNELNSLNDLIAYMEYSIQSRIQKSMANSVFLPLEYLTRAFDLNHFEANCLLLCLAVECDRKYEKLYSYLQDDVNCKYPTIDLALKLLCNNQTERVAARLSFTHSSPLMKYLMQNDDQAYENGTRLFNRLQLDRRLVHFFHNPLEIDPLLHTYTRFCTPARPLEPLLLDHDIQQRLRTWWERVLIAPNARQPLAVLTGPSGCGKCFQVQHLCSYFQTPLFIIDLAQMPVVEIEFQRSLVNIVRECLLSNAVPCFRHFDTILTDISINNKSIEDFDSKKAGRIADFMEALKELSAPLFILSSTSFKQPDFTISFSQNKTDFKLPNEMARKELWEIFSKEYTMAVDVDWGQMASKFRFSPGQIKNALLQAYESGFGRSDGEGRITLEELHASCFAQGRHYLGKTAAKINTVYTWQELILPTDTVELLMMACNQMKNRHIVFGKWGFEKRLAYGRGLSMLFSGLPGTGKTMAAQVIAKELNLELYRIDLAQVVSKYIGETEKNLRHVFQEAESSNAILFFDEADALFGKRSQVKDSHDRYANIEIAYLLQKVEEYDGISILATNLSKNLDDAFVRRITFIIEFPFPDAEYRKKIWISMFPAQTPLHSEIDFDFLSRRFELAGGNIKNIVLSAAFLAAEACDSIHMSHILRATKYEYQKIGRVLLREDLGEYYYEL
ncbi:MAG: AAA family ATPase, partial [Syntrophomonadaceae bacterium]|nr:AAA family ATPase [Syntrophomonadaceae bacterium]